MKKKYNLISLVICITLASTSLRSVEVDPEYLSPVQDVAANDTVSHVDSLAYEHSAQLMHDASESFKDLKLVQYDGTTEVDLYPMVKQVHTKVAAALADSLVCPENRNRLRGFMLDLDPLLIRGAIFYSSEGDREEMNRFARMCVDTRMLPDMRSMPFGTNDAAVYPSLVYCACSDAYNSGDHERAIDYFNEYLDGSGTEQREQVAMFLGQAALGTGRQSQSLDRLIAEANRYPANYNLLMITLQNCLEAGEYERMPPLMERALLMRPDDEQLLIVQASLLEDTGDFQGALEMYSRLYDLHPESLTVNKHLALCYYNLGADYYNQALTETDEKVAKRKMRQSQAYFRTASVKLATVVENDPANAKYLHALAMTYACLGETALLTEVNQRLTALGQDAVTVTGMPEAVTYADNQPGGSTGGSIPNFQDFARGYVETKLAEFSKRREFETTADFEKRINKENVYQEYRRLCKQAESDYLKKYAGRLRITDLKLEPYDIDNESYLINSAMGSIVLKVPFKGKEAETFKSGWNATRLRNPRFYIRDNMVAIASVDFVTPSGKCYSYSADNSSDYDYTAVIADLTAYLPGAGSTGRPTAAHAAATSKILQAKSDVDKDIPLTSRRAEKTIALVWANEDYKNVSKVSGALNDGGTFAEYCRRTLGIPESQVIEMTNLTYAEMLTSMRRLSGMVNALGGEVDVIFYYAGHGLPDEATKDAYLMPVDGDGMTTAVTYQLKKLYADLAGTRADNVMVFIDACFSGASREGGMLAEARGVALKPRAADPEGSMFVLSAASGQETALPYREKNHGMFTYFLLKKLQQTKGNVTLKELSDYVVDAVKKNSLAINKKLQTPMVRLSGNMSRDWSTIKMRP